MSFISTAQRLSISIIMALLLCACDQNDATAVGPGPGVELVEVYLQSRTPEGMQLLEFSHRNFPGQDLSSGRISVTGAYGSTEDRFIENRDAIPSALRRHGISDREIQNYMSRVRFPRQYVLGDISGTTYAFNAELNYHETVSGFVIHGDLQIERPHGLLERSIDASSSSWVVVESEAYWGFIYQITDDWDNRLFHRTEAVRFFEDILRGKSYTHSWLTNFQEVRSGASPIYEPEYVLNIFDDISWAVDERSFDRMTFSVRGTVRMLRAGRIANSNFNSGQLVEVVVEGSVTARDGRRAQFIVTVPDPRQPGRFYHTSHSYDWRDGYWGRNLGLTHTLGSRLDRLD